MSIKPSCRKRVAALGNHKIKLVWPYQRLDNWLKIVHKFVNLTIYKTFAYSSNSIIASN